MLVRFWMTSNPITVQAETVLDKALELMRSNKIRRLPVIRNDELCGILSLSDLYRFVAPDKTSNVMLPIEMAQQLLLYKVEDVMTPSPVSCSPNDALEDVGDLMRRQKIGAVPVTKKGQLEGIITESDILAAFAAITRLGTESKRICLRIPVETKIRDFYEISSLCEKYQLELLTLLTHPIEDAQEHLVMLRVRGPKVGAFLEALWNSKYQVLMVE